MKHRTLAIASALLLANFATCLAQNVAVTTEPEIPETLLLEALSSIQRGVNYLTDRQNVDGSWVGHPAVTGLCVMALHNSGTTHNKAVREDAVRRGLEYIRKFVQPDGSIWMAGKEREYPNYTTAIALATLATIGLEQDEQIMRNARRFLIGSQVIDENSRDFGGIGYGSAGPGKPDLSNTQWALEALYLTEYLDRESKAATPVDRQKSELAWKNAVQFLSRLQHVPETNDEVWVVQDKNDPNYGSFVYKTDESKAGAVGDERQTLRGYGSMTYAGLKSMIYAKLDKDDPRVKAAVEWGGKNYDLDQNPGIGPEGHYYYLHTFAKAYSVLGEELVLTPDGSKHMWRIDLIKKMLELQKGRGEWYNDKHGRWWESMPEMVTAYSLLAMQAALGPRIAR